MDTLNVSHVYITVYDDDTWLTLIEFYWSDTLSINCKALSNIRQKGIYTELLVFRIHFGPVELIVVSVAHFNCQSSKCFTQIIIVWLLIKAERFGMTDILNKLSWKAITQCFKWRRHFSFHYTFLNDRLGSKSQCDAWSWVDIH